MNQKKIWHKLFPLSKGSKVRLIKDTVFVEPRGSKKLYNELIYAGKIGTFVQWYVAHEVLVVKFDRKSYVVARNRVERI